MLNSWSDHNLSHESKESEGYVATALNLTGAVQCDSGLQGSESNLGRLRCLGWYGAVEL